MTDPTENGGAARDAAGRFLPGNPGGPGNPHARRAAQLRTALYEAVTPEDLGCIVQVLAQKAREGNIPAIKELLERLLGKAEAVDVLERLELLEERQQSMARLEDRRVAL